MCVRSTTCSEGPLRQPRSDPQRPTRAGRTIGMRTLVVFACVALLAAVEVDLKAQGAQAKAVWTAAAKAGDLWTCLQVEAWVRKTKAPIRLSPILGDSSVLGDPLLAVPGHIEYFHDGGDQVLVSSGGWVRLFAPDGRPLQTSVNIGLRGWQKQVSYGLGVIAALQRGAETAAGTRTIDVAAFRINDGAKLCAMQLALAATQGTSGRPAVADDGTVVATQVDTVDAVSGVTTSAIHVVDTANVQRIVANSRLVAVGRKGAWLLIRDAEGFALLVGTTRTPFMPTNTGEEYAVGPGIAAIVVKNALTLVGVDGAQHPISGGPAIGKHHIVMTIGDWLVVGSGIGAKMVSEGDLLGENAGAVVDQPQLIAMWRWADLAKDPAAKPVATQPGGFTRSYNRSAAIWAWDGLQVDAIDLRGDQPLRTAEVTVGKPIDYVSTTFNCMHVRFQDETSALYGSDRTEVWSGACSDVRLERPDLALIERESGDGVAYHLAKLSTDPAQRQEVRLTLPVEQQRITVSVDGLERVVAQNATGWWRVLGFDGKAHQTGRNAGPKAVAPPEVEPLGWFDAPGAWYSLRCRLVPKSSGPSGDPLARLDLRDAWRFGPTVVLLGQQGTVLVNGRKRGEWLDLGMMTDADHIALSGQQPALADGDGDDARLLATLVAGPKLDLKPNGGMVSNLPVGPWRIERQGQFTPPRGKQGVWDRERLGWAPERLRSPEGGNLLVITRPVVIELTPEAAKLVMR